MTDSSQDNMDLEEPKSLMNDQSDTMAGTKVASADEDEHSHYNPSNRGPIKNRSCTDVLCLLIFFAFCGGWVVVAIYAFANGNPMTLIYPSNSDGNICGRGEFIDKPNLLFFDLTKCFRVTALSFGCPTKQVCVAKCPEEIASPWALAVAGQGSMAKEKMAPYCGPLYNQSQSMTAEELIKKQICPAWFVTSRSILGRCIPYFSKDNDGNQVNDNTTLFQPDEMGAGSDTFTVKKLKKAVKTLAEILNLRNFGEKILNDLVNSWWIILIGLIIASAVAFLWIILMRFVAAVMVWASLILSIALLTLSCVYCGFKYTELHTADDSLDDFEFTTELGNYLNLSYTWLFFLIVSGIALLIILLVLCFMRTRIKIAIELIEEASIAVGDMMSTLFFPIVPFLFQVMLVAWFVAVGMFLASASEKEFQLDLDQDKCNYNGTEWKKGDRCDPDGFDAFQCEVDGSTTVEVTCQFHKYGPTSEAVYMQIYNLFGFFWYLFFLSALDEMVLAGAFASWYWTIDKKNVPSLPLTSSFYRTFRYHLGTLAFGSLIVAIIRMIRVMIEYVEQKLKEYHQDNPLVKALLCCCKCCFYCLEKFMKFINRNAYIMTAVYGKNFCWSAKEAFKLLFRNIARVFVLDKVTDFLLLLGKLVIVGSVGVGSFYVFSGRINALDSSLPELNYYFVPVIIITLGAYFIADIFFGVYEMAVDTLFLCFLEDIERNDGSNEKPYFMSKDLRKILGYMENSAKSSPAKSQQTRTPSPN